MTDSAAPQQGVDWEKIPAPSERHLALRVTPAAEQALRDGHPWLFDGAIRQQSCEGRPGDLAVVFDRNRRFVALGLYDPTSPIRVQVLVHGEPAPLDARWFREKVRAAARLRQPLLDSDTNGYRVVHGDNDGLPGLVVDRYDRTFVIKCYTPAWIPHLKPVLLAVLQSLPAQRVVLRLGRAARRQPDLLYGLQDGQVIHGDPLDGPLVFRENGLSFETDPLKGQKTGFYLDQRDNRARVERLSRGKSVLNVFAYSGAFGLYAARGGAMLVMNVDSNLLALQAGRRNVDLNRTIPAVAAARFEWRSQDAFEALEQLKREHRQFDAVILDPPAFATQQDQVAQALEAYARLTTKALAVLGPGGVLVQASCSSRVTQEDFFIAVHSAARAAGRPLRELERTGHGLDHPVTFREGAYLKCLFARTEAARDRSATGQRAKAGAGRKRSMGPARRRPPVQRRPGRRDEQKPGTG